ncbi:DUF2510 domain-containing protein [Ruania alba]|uniref:DUF2510 domain-containing protein n=1 Tax=Ruania alba TaxID=648782 RepID=A0A1H5HVU8_9MICO|nr:DUF2510 domain-containing protein [Ruania alba]SEE32226.1 Protein of unknown function [Ruania alba]
MSDQAAGWYPDPSGENQQRYWDGDSWTDYYAPALPTAEEPTGPQTAHEDYPYLAGVTHQRPDVMVTPGTPGAWSTSTAWGTPAPGKDDSGTKVFGDGVRKTPGGVAAVASLVVLAVLLVAGLGWWAVSGLRGDDPDPTGGPTGGGTTTTGTVTLDESTTGEVERAGQWEGTVSVSAETVVLLDVRSEDGEDLFLSVQDSSGSEIVEQDDRGRELADVVGGTSLDPLAMVRLPQGEYTVLVNEVRGEQSGLELIATAVTETVTVGERYTAEVPDDGYWVGVATVPEDGAYTIDVRDTGSKDPTLVSVDSDGRDRSNDDRDYENDELDPLIEADLPAGDLLLLVSEWHGDQTTVTIDVTGPA